MRMPMCFRTITHEGHNGLFVANLLAKVWFLLFLSLLCIVFGCNVTSVCVSYAVFVCCLLTNKDSLLNVKKTMQLKATVTL